MNAEPRHDPSLAARRLGIDTYLEPVVFMRADCHVCRAEGFAARSRVKVTLRDKSIVATLNVVHTDWLLPDEAGFSEHAWRMLGARAGDRVRFSHPDPIESESLLRRKVYGSRLDAAQMRSIIDDVAAGAYSDLQLAAFVTACAGDRLDRDETFGLTRAMVDIGTRIRWEFPVVADKHCVGGLPGNRTTLIVVPIVAACGLPIPKTSSRAITSPAGTADTMETLAPVALDLPAMRRVVEREGGCVVWGGAVALSPTDDVLIQVERPLDFDSEGQLVASVLSKKAAAGATHVVIDIPVGASAKVRSPAAARSLSEHLHYVAHRLGLTLRIMETDGAQPVGRGIGPALEAHDVLAVLQRRRGAAQDLRERALLIAGAVLELAGRAATGQGAVAAAAALDDGRAWAKFQAICEAQGGMREPPRARYRHAVPAGAAGRIAAFDNRRLARMAKLAGAPRAHAAGLEMHVQLGDLVTSDQPLFTLHAEAPGELEYAKRYLDEQPGIVVLEDAA